MDAVLQKLTCSDEKAKWEKQIIPTETHCTLSGDRLRRMSCFHPKFLYPFLRVLAFCLWDGLLRADTGYLSAPMPVPFLSWSGPWSLAPPCSESAFWLIVSKFG